jgi:hypothetical protein
MKQARGQRPKAKAGEGAGLSSKVVVHGDRESMRAIRQNADARGRDEDQASASEIVAAVRLLWPLAYGLWPASRPASPPALAYGLWPLARRSGWNAQNRTENNGRYLHDLIAFRIETTLKFDAKSSF